MWDEFAINHGLDTDDIFELRESARYLVSWSGETYTESRVERMLTVLNFLYVEIYGEALYDRRDSRLNYASEK